MAKVKAYRTIRLFWECPDCQQPHDVFDEGQLDGGAAKGRCISCLTWHTLILSDGD